MALGTPLAPGCPQRTSVAEEDELAFGVGLDLGVRPGAQARVGRCTPAPAVLRIQGRGPPDPVHLDLNNTRGGRGGPGPCTLSGRPRVKASTSFGTEP